MNPLQQTISLCFRRPHLGRGSTRARFLQPHRTRLHLRVLEDRLAPAIFNVATAADLSTAISTADSNGDSSNTINMAAGLYQLIEQVIQAPSSKTLIIDGPGAATTTIQSDGTTGRVFEVNANVTFETLTITGGFANDGGQLGGTAALGGGILIDGGQVTLNTVTVSNNIVQGPNGFGAGQVNRDAEPPTNGADAYGGGIYLATGDLTLINSQVSGNQVIGGIGGNGAVTPSPETSNNGANGGNAGGAGIYAAAGSTSLALAGTVVSSNTAQGGTGGTGQGGEGGQQGQSGAAFGGGLWSGAGQATLNTVTVSGNTALGANGLIADEIFPYVEPAAVGANAWGGGIYLGQGSSLTLLNSQVTSNHAIAGAGGPGANNSGVLVNYLDVLDERGAMGGNAYGGGIVAAHGSISLTLTNTTVNSNQAVGGNGGSGGQGPTGANGASGAFGTDSSVPGGTGGGGSPGDGGFNGESGGDGGAGGAAAGGGIYADDTALKLTQLTVDYNSVTGGNGGDGGDGGQGGYGGRGGNGGHGGAGSTGAPNGGNGGSGGDGAPGGAGGGGGNGGSGGVGGGAFGGGLYIIGNVTVSSSELSWNNVTGGAGGTGGQGGHGGGGGIGGSGGVGGGGGTGASGIHTDTASGNGGNGGSAGRSAFAGQGGAGGEGGVGGDGGTAFGGGACLSGGVATVSGSSIQDTATGGSGGLGGFAGLGGGSGDGGGQGAGTGSGGLGGYGGSSVPGGNGGNAGLGETLPPEGVEGGHGGSGGAGGLGGTAAGGAVYFDSGTLVVIASNLGSSAALGGHGGHGGFNDPGGFHSGGGGSVGGFGNGGGGAGAGGDGNPPGVTGQDAPGGPGSMGGAGGVGGNGGAGGRGGSAFGGSLYQNNGSVYLYGGSFVGSEAVGGNSGDGASGGTGGTGGLGGFGGSGGTATGVGIGGDGGDGGNGGNGGDSLTPGGAVGGDIYVRGTQNIWITGTTLGGSVQGGSAGLPGAAGAGGRGGSGGIGGASNGIPGTQGGSGNAGHAGNANGSGSSGDPTLSGGTLLTDTQPPTVTLQATNVTASNAAAQNPYIFSLGLLDNTFVDYQSVLAATVLVQPPTGPVLTAQLQGIVESGLSQPDGFNDAGSLAAVYEITPPGGNWTTAPAGTYSVILSGSPVTDLAGNAVATGAVGSFTVSLVVISPTSLAAAKVGVKYSKTLTATGGTSPFTFAITAGSLPSGLTLSSAGVLSGTPAAGGSFSFTVTATDSHSATGGLGYALTVNGATITVNPSSLLAATVGSKYSKKVTGSGGTAPYTFALTAGALPAGLSLSSTGALTGTPTAGGSFTFTITTTDSSTGTGPYIGSRSYTLSVKPAVITLSPTTLRTATFGVHYNATITAKGGTAPYSFTASPGSLPPGLTLSSGGVLSGTPTAAGTYTFTVTAQDSSTGTGPYTSSRTYTFVVYLHLSPASLPAGTVGVSYSKTITAAGGTGSYTFSVTAGAVPPGLTLYSNGVLSGVPTSSGTYKFTVTASDGNGDTGHQAYALLVKMAPAAPALDGSSTVTLPTAQMVSAEPTPRPGTSDALASADATSVGRPVPALSAVATADAGHGQWLLVAPVDALRLDAGPGAGADNTWLWDLAASVAWQRLRPVLGPDLLDWLGEPGSAAG